MRECGIGYDDFDTTGLEVGGGVPTGGSWAGSGATDNFAISASDWAKAALSFEDVVATLSAHLGHTASERPVEGIPNYRCFYCSDCNVAIFFYSAAA